MGRMEKAAFTPHFPIGLFISFILSCWTVVSSKIKFSGAQRHCWHLMRPTLKCLSGVVVTDGSFDSLTRGNDAEMLINIVFQSPRKKGKKASLLTPYSWWERVSGGPNKHCLNWPVKAELSDGHNDCPSPERSEREEMEQNQRAFDW